MPPRQSALLRSLSSPLTTSGGSRHGSWVRQLCRCGSSACTKASFRRATRATGVPGSRCAERFDHSATLASGALRASVVRIGEPHTDVSVRESDAGDDRREVASLRMSPRWAWSSSSTIATAASRLRIWSGPRVSGVRRDTRSHATAPLVPDARPNAVPDRYDDAHARRTKRSGACCLDRRASHRNRTSTPRALRVLEALLARTAQPHSSSK